MVDITHKTVSKRSATAQAIVTFGNDQTIIAIQNNLVPKGNVLEVARTAGLFAVKNTSSAIPDCHPLPIEFTQIRYEFLENAIAIFVDVQCIYRTGVEVEAMHGAAIVALTMYDMLKPIDKGVQIQNIQLISKKGGKSDLKRDIQPDLKIAVIVCSDSISAGKKKDTAGKVIIEKLNKMGQCISSYTIIPDEILEIENKLFDFCNQNYDLIIYTGGTGLSKRDISPEALTPHLDRRIPGIEEAIRSYGQERTPYAMLSRSVVGFRKNTLVMALPGSTNGAAESIDAVFPSVLHLFKIINGFNHDK